VKVDPNLSAQQIESLAHGLGIGIDTEGLREKQIEKAQKLLLTKLTTNDYNNQGNQTSVLMTPEQ
jgi:hypothetical protein